MLKINRDNQSFSVLDTPTLADVSITERYDLQEYICKCHVLFQKDDSATYIRRLLETASSERQEEK